PSIDQTRRDRCDQDSAPQIVGATLACEHTHCRDLADLGRNIDPGWPRLAWRAARTHRVAPFANRSVDIFKRLQVFESRMQCRSQRAQAAGPACDYEQPPAV